MRSISAGRISALVKCKAMRRKSLRNILFETLENRALMTSGPSLFPPLGDLPPAFLAPPKPGVGPGNMSLNPGPSSDPGFIFGPREKVWVSEVVQTMEGDEPGRLRIERTNTKSHLQVTWRMLRDSTAQPGIDYIEPKPIFEFAPGQSTIDVPMLSIDDDLPEPTETFRFVLADSSRIGTWVSPDIVTFQITDNDLGGGKQRPFVELLPPTDGEEGVRDGRIIARRTGLVDQTLTVPLEWTYHAGLAYGKDITIDKKHWVDETKLAQFQFEPGATLAAIDVKVIDDKAMEATEWADVQLVPSKHGEYQVAGKTNQTIRILDNDSEQGNSGNNDENGPIITSISLVNDTGSSPSDRLTWDERVQIQLTGKLPSGSVIAELDWTGDFIPEARIDRTQSPDTWIVDPKDWDPQFAEPLGLRSLHYRTIWLNNQRVPIQQSPWKSFGYSVEENPTQGPLRLKNLRLKLDTDRSDDLLTTYPVVQVQVHGAIPANPISVEWDQSGDGIADERVLLDPNQRNLDYDPRKSDPQYASRPGSRTIRVRLVDSETRQPVVPWESIQFAIPEIPKSNLIVDSIQQRKGDQSFTEANHVVRGVVLSGKITEVQGLAYVSPTEPPEKIFVDIEMDSGDQATVTIPIDDEYKFDYRFQPMKPGSNLVRFRAKQWNNELQLFNFGDWTEFRFDWFPAETPTIRSIRLRNPIAPEKGPARSSDPGIFIEVQGTTSSEMEVYVEADIDGDGNANQSIRVGEQGRVLFLHRQPQLGIQQYAFRAKVVDPITGWQKTDKWQPFVWFYEAPTLPSFELKLLRDDGVSTTDRITSLSTVLGKLIGPFDEKLVVQVDSNEDGKEDLMVRPETDGGFVIRLGSAPLGRRQVSVRVESIDPYLGTKLQGRWHRLEFELVAPPEGSRGRLQDLRLVHDTGVNNTDRVTSIATIAGSVTTSIPMQRIDVDRNQDGIPDDQVEINSQGDFIYTPLGLAFGSHVFAFRQRGMNSESQKIVSGDWQNFDFTYLQATIEPLAIDWIELVNDSGVPGDRKSEQGAIAGQISSPSGVQHSVILVDWNQDRRADATLTVGLDGRFLFDPPLKSFGQATYSFQPLRLLSDGSDSGSQRWTDFTFVLEDQSDLAPEVDGLTVVTVDDGNQVIQGSVRSQRPIETVQVELDIDRDGLPEGTIKLDRFGKFGFGCEHVQPGKYIPQIRAIANPEKGASLFVGAWKQIPLEIKDTPSASIPIRELRLVVDDGESSKDRITSDPRVTGRVDRLGRGQWLVIEFDINRDGVIDDHVIVSRELDFHWNPPQLPLGDFQLRARTRDTSETGKMVRSGWTELTGRLVSKPANQITIGSLQLEINQGSGPEDLRSSNPTLVGTISDNTNRNTNWLLELDYDGDGKSDTQRWCEGNQFRINPELTNPGWMDLSVRVRNGDESLRSPWRTISFLYHPQPTGAEANALAAAYRSISVTLTNGKERHLQGLAKLLTDYASQKGIADREEDYRTEKQWELRWNRLREEVEKSHQQISRSAADTRISNEESVKRLRAALEIAGANEQDYPLPIDVMLKWPDEHVPDFPFSESVLTLSQLSLPTPPVQQPGVGVDGFATDQEFTAFEASLLENYSPYQIELQRLESMHLSKQMELSKELHESKARVNEIAETELRRAEEDYRHALERNGSAFNGFFREDYFDLCKQFLEWEKTASIEYTNAILARNRKTLMDQETLIARRDADIGIAKKNRDAVIEDANRVLASVLNALPPPSSGTKKDALLRYARQVAFAQRNYDQALLAIRIEYEPKLEDVLRDGTLDHRESQSEYVRKIASLQKDLAVQLADRRASYGQRRATAAFDWDKGNAEALNNLESSRNEAEGKRDLAHLPFERDYRSRMDQANRDLELAQAKAALEAAQDFNRLDPSPRTYWMVRKSAARFEKLEELEPIHREQSRVKHDDWLINRSAVIRSHMSHTQENLAAKSSERLGRLEATKKFWHDHADLVKIHEQSRAEFIYNDRVDQEGIQRQHFISKHESGKTHRRKSFDIDIGYQKWIYESGVYVPPKLNFLGDEGGWIDGRYIGGAMGWWEMPQDIFEQKTRDKTKDHNANAYEHQIRDIATDRRYIEERNNIRAVVERALNTLKSSSSAAEYKLQQNYHLDVAEVDRDSALALLASQTNLDLALGVAALDYRQANSDREERFSLVEIPVLNRFEFECHTAYADFATRTWDDYVKIVRDWGKMESSPSTVYVVDRAIANQTWALKGVMAGKEQAERRSEQNGADSIARGKIQSVEESSRIAEELRSLKDRLKESKNFSMKLVEAKFKFATSIAGVSLVSKTGPNWEYTERSIENPHGRGVSGKLESLLPLQQEAVTETADAYVTSAKVEFTYTDKRIDADDQLAIALRRALEELNRSNFDWENYIRQVELAQRLHKEAYANSLEERNASLLKANEVLRERRAEIVRKLNIVNYLNEQEDAKWYWIKDIPRLAPFAESESKLLAETRIAGDNYAASIARIQRELEVSLAEASYKKALDASRLTDARTAKESQADVDFKKQVENERIRLESVLRDAEWRYGESRMKSAADELRSLQSKLDPATAAFFEKQFRAIQEKLRSRRNAEETYFVAKDRQSSIHINEVVDSNQRLGNTLLGLRGVMNEELASQEKEKRIEIVEIDSHREKVIRNARNRLNENKGLVRHEYDRECDEALAELNLKLLEERKKQANEVGEHWKSYYLAIHGDTIGGFSYQQRSVDNWFGFSATEDHATGAAWRSEPLGELGADSLDFNSTNTKVLHQRLSEMRSKGLAILNELYVGFTTRLGQAKQDLVRRTSDSLSDYQQTLFDSDTQAIQDENRVNHNFDQVRFRLKREYASSRSQSEKESKEALRDAQGLYLQRLDLLENTRNRSVMNTEVSFHSRSAEARATYFVTIFRDRAKVVQNHDLGDGRSAAIASHAQNYARWLETVAPDFEAWIRSDNQAKVDRDLDRIDLERVRGIRERLTILKAEADKVQEEHAGNRKKDELQFQREVEDKKETERFQEGQRELDHSLVMARLEHEKAYRISLQQAESIVRQMGLKGSSAEVLRREKTVRISDAESVRMSSDADAVAEWRRDSAKLSLNHQLEIAKRSNEVAKTIDEIDKATGAALAQIERRSAGELASATSEYQVGVVDSDNRLRDVETRNWIAWRNASTDKSVTAREDLARAFPGEWSEFLYELAKQERESQVERNGLETTRTATRNSAEKSHVEITSNAERKEKRERFDAEFVYQVAQLDRNNEHSQKRGEAIIDFLSNLQKVTEDYVDQMVLADQNYSKAISTAKKELAQDRDEDRFRIKTEEAKRIVEHERRSAVRAWNRNRIEAIAIRRSKESDWQRDADLLHIAIDVTRAQEKRDARTKWLVTEANAYAESLKAWSEADRVFAKGTIELNRNIAKEVDTIVDSAWSDLYQEWNSSEGDHLTREAEVTNTKRIREANVQAEFERQQAQIESAMDFRAWEISSASRTSLVGLDWTLERTKVEALRAMASLEWLGRLAPSVPEPAETGTIGSHPTDWPTDDTRYALQFREHTALQRGFFRGGLEGIHSLKRLPFQWQDVGFLKWIRYPHEQFPEGYWRIVPTDEPGAKIVPPEMPAPSNLIDESTEVPSIGASVYSSQIPVMPTETITEVTLSEFAKPDYPIAMDWWNEQGRVLNAPERPDHDGSISEQSMNLRPLQLPSKRDTDTPQALKRFFVTDKDQWQHLLDAASGQLGGLYDPRKYRSLQSLVEKFKRHVDEKRWNVNDHLEKIGGFQIERSDSIDVENGKVYWRYNVLANPSPSTLIPNQHVSSEIGTVDRNGWVYLPSGRRVLLSGLKKWAKEHTQATPRKINGLIDALISPFHIEANSKQYGIFIGGTGMHFYGVGNVERLYNIYSGTKFYYGGVGNPVEYDSLKKLYLDNATGLGWEAIVNRIEADLQTHYKSGQIVHIFGWSRGGAMAHEFTKKMEKYGIRVAFLGMFDPVYSHTLPGQNSNHVEWTLTGQFGNYVTAIQTKNAKAISVIYAINEDRSFFPATQFYPDKLSKVKLFKSPGGHGEIGGHFQSNLIVQRMNMRAMLEFASLDGKAEFQYLGLDTDLVRIYGSRLTQEIAVGDQDSASTQTDYDQYRDALELDTWKPMNATEYLQAFVDFTPAEWSPGAFGYQQDYWTGALAWGAEFVVRRNEISFPWIKQVPLSHYSRNLSWVPLELWDLEMLKNPIANNIITEQKKAHIRHIYGYKINPKIGGWMP